MSRYALLLSGLSCSLAFMSVASATSHPPPDSPVARQAFLASHSALQGFRDRHRLVVASLGLKMHPSLGLLWEHHKLYYDPGRPTESIASGEDWEVFTKHGSLFVNIPKRLQSFQHRPEAAASRLELGTLSALGEALAPHLLKAAGLTGDPSNPALLASAHKIVEEKVANAVELTAIVNGKQPHANLELLVEVHEARRALGQTTKPLHLAVNGSNALEGARASSGEVYVLHMGEHMGHTANLEELHAFNIKTKLDFDRLVDRAIGEIAPEDLEESPSTTPDGKPAR